MSYQALYRKFRPDAFEDVKGQAHIVTTLMNQIKADRIGHAYLFCGTRGTGKTTIAKLFAKAVNCENPKEDKSPCLVCDTCKAIGAAASMNVIEIDAASNNGVDNIREIVEEVSYSPTSGKYKVYIIDEVHMLSTGAFNALLKTLEEPPGYVIFILATTEVHKIPITILSRCQRYDFKRITVDTIASRLYELMEIEGIEVEEAAIRYIAKMADGSMRDALSLLDQCIAFHFGKTLTYDLVLDVLGAIDASVYSEFVRFIANQEITKTILKLEEIVMQGKELTQFVADFTWYLRNLLLVSASEDARDTIDVSTENYERLVEESKLLKQSAIIRYIRIFAELSSQIRYSQSKRILIEMTLIKLCKPQMEVGQDSLIERIRLLEDKLEQGFVPMGQADQGKSEVKNQQLQTRQRTVTPPIQAVPQDIQEIIRKWAGVIASLDAPMKVYLKTAKLSLHQDKNLLIGLEDGPASDYFLDSEENRDKLKQHLEQSIGKEVTLHFKAFRQMDEFEQSHVDLSKLILMEIEEE